MKIAYVFQEDAADPTVDSGRPASILRELGNAGVDLEPVFPVDLPVLPKILSAPSPPKTNAAPIPPPPLALLSSQLEERARREHFDLIFSPGTEIISRLRVTVPLSFFAPATFGNLVDYYPAFTGLSEEQLRAGHAREATALQRARGSRCIRPSGPRGPPSTTITPIPRAWRSSRSARTSATTIFRPRCAAGSIAVR